MSDIFTSVPQVFEIMSKVLATNGSTLVNKIKGCIIYDITGSDAWYIDVKNGNGSVRKATQDDKADLRITVKEDTFLAMVNNKTTSQKAFMSGQLKIKGNMGLAMKLTPLSEATREYAEKSISSSTKTSSTSSSSSLKSAKLFDVLSSALEKETSIAKKVDGVIQFTITPSTNIWIIDLKATSKPHIYHGNELNSAPKPDVTISVSDDDFIAIATGKLSGQMAFMKGKLKVKGKMPLAMKLPVVFSAIQKKPTSKL